MLKLITATLFFTFTTATSSQCSHPLITSTTYTTFADAPFLSYISEFRVRCRSAGSVPNLYALVGGSVQPVGAVGPDTFQISWTEERSSVRTRFVKIFDDEGYALLRRARRAGEDLGRVQPFEVVAVQSVGAYEGLRVGCECVAVMFSLLVCCYAVHFRAKLLA